MQKIDLNDDWQFYESNEANAFSVAMPDAVETVSLPHDFIVRKPREPNGNGGADSGYFGEGEGVYRKTLDIPAEWKDKTILLDIDGAYMLAEVTLNREFLALHPYGYTPFLVDLMPALRFDGRKNILKIITQSRQPSCRWYSGGGLYRSVRLWVGEKAYIKPWEVFVTTPEISTERAVVRFQYEVSGETAGIEVELAVIDREGNTAAKSRASHELIIEKPHLWDLETPYLYRYRVTLLRNGKVVDVSEDAFGIRKIEVDADNGFRLNGKPMKLKGGCIHHDNGFLGACAYEDAERRKVRVLKQMGYNTLRISHNPPSLSLLRVCDEEGMLLMDEAFDQWVLGSRPLDYHLYFERCWQSDIAAMVKRDRNHPSVITWSIGNEIAEANGSNHGCEWSRRLAEEVRKYDGTRPVLAATCGLFPDIDDGLAMDNIALNTAAGHEEFARQVKPFFETLDIAALNYLLDTYDSVHAEMPDKPILCTESFPFTTYDYWKAVEQRPYVIGDCIWAAVDYLGEVGGGNTKWEGEDGVNQLWSPPYPWRTSWQSDFDLTLEQRPQGVYREIMWGNDRKCGIFVTHPQHYGKKLYGTGWHWHRVKDSWTFGPEYIGKPVRVDVYGAGDEAELYINGSRRGRSRFDRLIASFDVSYEPGKIGAVVYRDGQEIARASLETTGETEQLTAALEYDGRELSFYRIYAVDSAGRRVLSDKREICVSVTGGELLVVGSGAFASEDVFGKNCCHLYRGSAVAIVRKRGEVGITVK